MERAMKKCVFLLSSLMLCSISLSALPVIPFTIGAAFPNYEHGYLMFNTGAYFPLEGNMEFSLTGSFGVRTETLADDSVNAYFFIPINCGVNFLFPRTSGVTFFSGFGMNTQMIWEDDYSFHLGPYAKAGIRYRVHKNLQLLVEIQQDLTFGPPAWINTTTQVLAGIVCNFN